MFVSFAMQLKHRWLFFIVILFLFLYYLILYCLIHNPRNEHNSFNISTNKVYYHNIQHRHENNEQKVLLQVTQISQYEEIVIGVVVCGDRFIETMTMLKSAILFNSFTKHPLRIVVVTEENLKQNFSEKLGEWKAMLNNTFNFELHDLSFPTKYGTEWKSLFKPCAAQRLFFPSLLPHIEKMLYVDTDVVFLAPLSKLWDHFYLMNSTQMAALSPEHEDPSVGWYNRFARHPYYGKMGVNSGVMLMHFQRMRQFGWVKYLAPIYKEFKLTLTWGDQDIINIFFHFHPERLLVYSCRYNYRTDHCMYLSTCAPAEKHGVVVLHGSRGSFHSEKQPAFRAIYRAVEEYQLTTDPYEYLLLPMKSYLEETSHTTCGKLKSAFMRHMESVIKPQTVFGMDDEGL